MTHAIVSRDEWLQARKALPAKERAMTHEFDALQRRRTQHKEAVWRRIGDLLDRFPPDECGRYLVNAGYASS